MFTFRMVITSKGMYHTCNVWSARCLQIQLLLMYISNFYCLFKQKSYQNKIKFYF